MVTFDFIAFILFFFNFDFRRAVENKQAAVVVENSPVWYKQGVLVQTGKRGGVRILPPREQLGASSSNCEVSDQRVTRTFTSDKEPFAVDAANCRLQNTVAASSRNISNTANNVDTNFTKILTKTVKSTTEKAAICDPNPLPLTTNEAFTCAAKPLKLTTPVKLVYTPIDSGNESGPQLPKYPTRLRSTRSTTRPDEYVTARYGKPLLKIKQESLKCRVVLERCPVTVVVSESDGNDESVEASETLENNPITVPSQVRKCVLNETLGTVSSPTSTHKGQQEANTPQKKIPPTHRTRTTQNVSTNPQLPSSQQSRKTSRKISLSSKMQQMTCTLCNKYFHTQQRLNKHLRLHVASSFQGPKTSPTHRGGVKQKRHSKQQQQQQRKRSLRRKQMSWKLKCSREIYLTAQHKRE